MTTLSSAKACELHIHIGGCFSAEDLFELGYEHRKAIDWTLFHKSISEAEFEIDTEKIFQQLYSSIESDHLIPFCVFSEADKGNFKHFQTKYNFALCIFRHWWHHLGRLDELMSRIFIKHQEEGIRYVEYRALAPHSNKSPEALIHFHSNMATAIKNACNKNFSARYIISLPRSAPLECYKIIRKWLEERKDLFPFVVGFDLCHFEEGYPPSSTYTFFEQLNADNKNNPTHHLDVVYHVGEVFFDKSIESAVRWCHEAVKLGVKRLGHCLALGFDPRVALERKPRAHIVETITERVAQIEYDLQHANELQYYGVNIDKKTLLLELRKLNTSSNKKFVERPYSNERITEIQRRQNFVLAQITNAEVAIESCPTSNMLIGDVPTTAMHPIHRFLDSDVGLVIGSDDPGVFNSTLSDEIDWVLQNTSFDANTLAKRIGDPLRWRLSQKRENLL